MFGRNLDPLSCEPALGREASECFHALMSAVGQVTGRAPGAPGVGKGAGMVWALSHGSALLALDRATAPLPAAERPGASDLAALILRGLAR